MKRAENKGTEESGEGKNLCGTNVKGENEHKIEKEKCAGKQTFWERMRGHRITNIC
jgi:hypothetical protein